MYLYKIKGCAKVASLPHVSQENLKMFNFTYIAQYYNIPVVVTEWGNGQSHSVRFVC